MTIICKFNTNFNTENIGKYIDLNQNKIVEVNYKNCDVTIQRSLIKSKKRRKNKKKNIKSFYNQTTIRVKSEFDDNIINVKIFKNGSIQMTGCKSIQGCINVLKIVCKDFSVVKAIIDPETISKVILKPFIDKPSEMNIDRIYDFKVCMINSGFNIGFKIDREELYSILTEQQIECTCNLDSHACVNIKYNYKNRKKVSIFVFASGAVIITGSNNCNHIIEAYEFITMMLVDNYQRIKNVDNILNRNDIRDFLNKNKV